MRLLFLHGAGGYDDDQPLARALGESVGATVELPRLPDEDMSVAAWATPIRERLSTLGKQDLLVAHSFGASTLLQVLAQLDRLPMRATLLATPDWGPDGWDIAEYVFAGPEPRTAVSLHHCEDDEIVPVDHLERLAALLPRARVSRYPTGGHQLVGQESPITQDLVAR